MKIPIASRLVIIGLLFIALFGVRSDQGSTLEPSSLPLSPHGRVGVYLTSFALTKESTLANVLAAAEQDKLNAVVINVKNMHGEVTYDTAVPLARTIGAEVDRIEPRKLIRKLHAAGIYVIARQVLFYDPKLAAYLGLDGPWVPPDNPQAVAYNLRIAQEVASLGFDELQFDYLRFPDGGGLMPGYDARYEAVDRFLQAARRLLSGRITLSVDVFGRVLWDWNRKKIDPIGQSLEEIAPWVDFISPMLYPSHYHEEYYKHDPYRVVTEALQSGKARVKTPFRPFLQAFDLDIPAGMSLEEYIQKEIKAAQAAGADGYLFWNPGCNYTALYNALGVILRNKALGVRTPG